MISHNLSKKPIKKEKILRNKKLINLQKIGIKDSDFRVSKLEYMTILDLVQSKEY